MGKVLIKNCSNDISWRLPFTNVIAGIVMCHCHTRKEGFLKRRNTKIGLFSRRNFGKMYIFWRISEVGVLTDTEISILTDISNGYFEIIETEIGNHTPLDPPILWLLSSTKIYGIVLVFTNVGCKPFIIEWILSKIRSTNVFGKTRYMLQ